MRYWIHWNDLVQGPFELDELIHLKAFSEDLPVCMEDREDWVPACRVADLSSAIEQLRSARMQPLPPPPPPPPRDHPHKPVLQGEFFAESSDQMHMFEGGDLPGGPQAYVRVEDTFIPPGAQSVFWSSPFRFVQMPSPTLTQTATVLLEPLPSPPSPPPPPPIVFFQAPPVRDVHPPIVTESPLKREAMLSASELAVDAPVQESAAIPLGLAPDETFPAFDPIPAPASVRTFNWRPFAWTLGVSAAILLLAFGGYQVFDYLSTRSALNAVRQEVRSAPVVPAVPAPVPVLVKPAVAVKMNPPVIRKKRAAPPAPIQKVLPRVVKSAPAIMPGLSESPAPLKPAPPSETVQQVNDPWLGRHNEAISIVSEKKIAGGKQSIGSRAAIMLQQMHDKELLHAADTGTRLYEPDKITWSALREEGSRYRVYLNFSALQVNGERAQTRSYPFVTDLATRQTTTDDVAARTDFLDVQTILTHPRDPRAKDIENMLAGVDQLYKHKMRAIIVRNNRKNKAELQRIEAAVAASLLKLQRSIAYIREKYSDQQLMNVANAYGFLALVK